MKPTSNLRRLPAIDKWHHQPRIKNPLLHRIRNITGEIHSLHEEMHGKLGESAIGHPLPQLLEDGLASHVLNDFKAELDQLRRILWFYIEEASGKRSKTDAEHLDDRLQRVNELLRTLAPRPIGPAAPEAQSQPSISFFERLDVVIDTYMQEKKPVAQVKAAKAGH